MVLKVTAESTRKLVDCAMGRLPADLVIRKGQWVSVQSGEIVPETDIAILNDRIAYVGPDASHTIGAQTKIIEAKGRFLVPGLMDGHMHVESGMLTVTEFVRAVVPHGTTAMFVDPHEIANIFGLKGVRLMVDEAADQPVHVFVQAPSCVPSAPGFETPGASISPADVAEMMEWPGIVGLGEMMNFPGVFNGQESVHAEMAATRNAGKVIGGHYASPDMGLPFYGYAAGGAEDDHEGTTVNDAIQRARQGMKVMMRYGSAWHDVAAQVKAVTEKGLDSRRFLLCTDDSHSATLVKEGHMDRVLRHAIAQGLDPLTAIQMATINTAEHFGVSRDMGLIAPGRFADIVLAQDLKDFAAELVIARGQVVAEEGALRIEHPARTYPDWVLNSVHLPRPKSAADFGLKAENIQSGTAIAHVIGVIENQAPNRHLHLPVKVADGLVKIDLENDIIKIALVERHVSSGRVQVGLVHGFNLAPHCAIATTVAHDSHHLIVIGTDDAMMAQAVNELAACGGGQVVVKEGQVIGKVRLPIAGLMSDQPARIVAEEAATVLRGFVACGCNLNNPNMQLSLMALVVIPELRISDLGVVDVRQFKFVSVIEREEKSS
ncbi:MAG TPA: adenine deaminase [Anaerolineaceae bacterium]|nr:MAG: adenine deaminase [Chloroflexi bacterium GWB2_54_36]HAL17984.1 adenine deaminase [Anaerolineaceae bacterium]HBA91125.1 adenine deaminase [Anaerolineaceae bacterium]